MSDALRIPAPAVTLTELEDKDWVAENQRSFLPFSIGRFFIYPSFHHGGVPKGQTGIQIDPGMAFGTGTHATTRGCLMAIDEIGRAGQPESAIDVGCGSGILAIALTAIARRRVLACDNDPVAVQVTEDNARINGVDGRVIAVQSEGLDNDVIRRRSPVQPDRGQHPGPAPDRVGACHCHCAGQWRTGRAVGFADQPGAGGDRSLSRPGHHLAEAHRGRRLVDPGDERLKSAKRRAN